MRPRSLKEVWDISVYAEFVMHRTAGMSAEEYAGNLDARLAVQHALLICGEAMNRIRRDDPETHALFGASGGITELRHRLAHAYDRISNRKIWLYVNEFVPTLMATANQILDPYRDEFE